ncbi:MAG: glycosyl hydrolase 108 family protein [Bacteroidota bacterium]
MDLKQLIERTLKHEGGFQNNPKDSGNWTGGKIGLGINKGTNFGISAARYPLLDIRNLTREQAVEIYIRDYYEPLKMSEIKSVRVQWKLFDIGVNMGTDDPPKIVRSALKDTGYITGDGLEYLRVNDAIAFMGEGAFLRELAEWQMKKYVSFVTKDPVKLEFLPHWTIRAFDIGDGLT